MDFLHRFICSVFVQVYLLNDRFLRSASTIFSEVLPHHSKGSTEVYGIG